MTQFMIIKIEPMKPADFQEIARIDEAIFNRDGQIRPVENIAALFCHASAGCFVAKNSGVVGYVFSKILGDVGYVGPLGVMPKYRGGGLGKQMIEQSVQFLKNAGCKTIGLETRAEIADNIGLYMAMGFRPAPITLSFVPKQSPQTSLSQDVYGKYEICPKEADLFFHKVTKASGIDLGPDFRFCENNGPADVYFVKNHGELNGFLAYTPILYPHVWGGFINHFSNQDFMALYKKLQQKNLGESLAVRANSRYTSLYKLIGRSFNAERCLVRMLLNGYEGDFLNETEAAVVLRSWIS